MRGSAVPSPGLHVGPVDRVRLGAPLWLVGVEQAGFENLIERPYGEGPATIDDVTAWALAVEAVTVLPAPSRLGANDASDSWPRGLNSGEIGADNLPARSVICRTVSLRSEVQRKGTLC